MEEFMLQVAETIARRMNAERESQIKKIWKTIKTCHVKSQLARSLSGGRSKLEENTFIHYSEYTKLVRADDKKWNNPILRNDEVEKLQGWKRM